MRVGTFWRTAVGQQLCGDACVVVEHGQRVLMGVADGEGHGPKAAEAAHAFCSYLRENPDLDLETLARGVHKAVSGERGASAVMLSVDVQAHTLEFLGIGNVEIQSCAKARIRPLNNTGLIGRRLNKLNRFRFELTKGDVVAAYSDGISSRMDLAAYRLLDVQEIAQNVVRDHGKDHDDAICLAFRY